MQRPFIHPYAYSILILLITTITATTVFILLLLLVYYCHCYKTIATDKLLRASVFPGAADMTNQPSKLIFILWLSLCRINKFGLYYPRRLFRSPILVGHHEPSLMLWDWLTAAAKQHYPTRTRVPGLEFGAPNPSSFKRLLLCTLFYQKNLRLHFCL